MEHQSLVELVEWKRRFPTMLQASEVNVQLLLGHYAHSLGCFQESALHFMQASRVNPALASLETSFSSFPEYIVWSSVSLEQCFDCLSIMPHSCQSRIAGRTSLYGDCSEIGCTEVLFLF